MNQSIILGSQNRLTRDVILVFIGIALLGLSAQLVIPFKPVPLTFQSAMVVLLGMVYGTRLGALTVVGYLFFGALGLPLFEDLSSGLHVLTGSTAGYLFGFLPAAMLGGFLVERGFASNIFTAFLSAILSASVIFFFGLSFLAKFIGWQSAITLGLMPFIVTEPLKLFAIACVIPRLWKVSQK